MPVTGGQFNTKSPTIKRILKEASELAHHPSGEYTAEPLEDNLFEWHFTLRGPPEPSPYAQGIYHGRIVLPPSYPLRPPAFRFLTPTGRFEVNREICLSISGHHEETWQPAWGIRTAMVAIRSFMDTDAKGQLGGLECDDGARRRMANESRKWACRACGKSNEQIISEAEQQACSSAGNADATLSSSETGSAGSGGTAADLQKQTDAVPNELRLAYRDELRPDDGGSTDAGNASTLDEHMQASNAMSMEFTGTALPISTTSETPRPSSSSSSSGLQSSLTPSSTTSTSTAPVQAPLPVQPPPVTSAPPEQSSPSSLSAPRSTPATTTATPSPGAITPAARPAHAVPLQPTPTSPHPLADSSSQPSAPAPPSSFSTSSSVFPSISSTASSSPRVSKLEHFTSSQPQSQSQTTQQASTQTQTSQPSIQEMRHHLASQNLVQAQAQAQAQSARRRQDVPPVPDWLDKAIYGVAAALIFMIVKKLLFL